MTDFQGPGPSWSPEIIAKEREIREGEAMEVERIADNGPIFYRVYSTYANDTLAFTPRELLQLLVFLQDLEQQIIADSQANRTAEAMREIERDEPPSHDDIHTVEAYRREYEMKQSDGEWVNGDEED